MSKRRRHNAIKELVEKSVIKTQYQLTEELIREGFNITQATVSRDIKEIGLIKVIYGENSSRYSLSADAYSFFGGGISRTRRMLRENMLKLDFSENIIVMHTLPGTAQALAACLDGLGKPEIIGTLAGDDTVLIIIKETSAVKSVLDKIQSIVD